MDNQSVTGRLILQGKIKLLTPLIIGSGKSEISNIEVLRDAQGKPFIPATSFVGVLRHRIATDDTQSNYFWGDSMSDGVQSALICHDLKVINEKADIRIRDGVKIDPKNGIAIDQKKYDYEVVEPGIEFNMYLEVVIRDAYDQEYFKQIISTIVDLLKKKVSFGAKTASGFGQCELIEKNYFEFNFTQKDDVLRWLNQDFTKLAELKAPLVSRAKREFSIDAWFSIKNSLIVKSYEVDPQKTYSPDATHITSNGKSVLPGTSVKGAVRNRAVRILNTLIDNPEQKIKELFGYVDEDGQGKKQKSRVIIEETEIRNPIAEMQTRIKIDRFTGGTIKTALFESMPLWGNGSDKIVNIKITINNYKDWDAGLMLLILKDLWNEDLAIGGEKNIGRGVLKGSTAEIKWGENKTLRIEDKNGRLEISDHKLAEELDKFIEEVCNA